MLLTYIDESGTNWKKTNGFWLDSPYIIWTGLMIPENKYFHVERMFYDLAKELLNITDWRRTELHATDLWNQAETGKRKKEDVRKYFEELFQLLTKLDLKVVASIHQKNSKIGLKNVQLGEMRKSIFAFMHGIEYKLSQLNETSILIADSQNKEEQKKRFTDLEELVYNRTQWRYNPGQKSKWVVKSRYNFEARSCFILDQLYYADSKDCLFIQLVDHISFVVMKVFTYLYLKTFPTSITPDLEKVPLSSETFNFFAKFIGLQLTWFEKELNDITIITLDSNNVYGTTIVPNNYLNLSLHGFTPYK